jgi:hypothetical protein
MCTIKKILLCITLLGLCGIPCKGQAGAQCEWLDNVLKEVRNLENGSTRTDVEKIFETDGGITSGPLECRYVYKKCSYIKVDVRYREYIPKSEKRNPQDKVVKISRPYIERPIYD